MNRFLTATVAVLLTWLAADPALALNDGRIRRFNTAALLEAYGAKDGDLGYALDTDTFYIYANGAWSGISTLIALTGDNGGEFSNGTDNKWKLEENSEDVSFSFGSNTLTLESASSVATLLTAFDLSLSGGAGAITLTDSASSAVIPNNDATAWVIGGSGLTNLLTFDTTTSNQKLMVTGTTTATAFHVDVGTSLFDEGVSMAVPAAALDVIRFCGQGPNATTPTYIGPVLLDDTEADLAFGGAGCDALDNTTEGTADAPWHASFAFKPVAMVCTSTCGTDDTMTLQLRDDTADVAGMTCNITLVGAAAQCSVRDATPATVAANSAIAVKVVNGTDDNCSAGDVECLVYITF